MKRALLLLWLIASNALSHSQINFTPGLKSYHPMNDDYYNVTGNVALNSNVNTDFHQLFYDASFGADSSAIANNAGFFDGTSRVNINKKLLNADTDDFTIEFWFKTAALTDQVFYWEGINTDFRIYIRLEPAMDRIRANIGNLGNNGIVHEVSTTEAFNDGFWHHYALTMTNGTTSVVYIDGVQDVTNTLAYPLGSTTNFTRFGCNNSIAQFLDGSMDNMRVWDHPLSPAEITILYNLPKIVITDVALTSCVETSFDLPFEVSGGTGTFESTNIFYAQLSDINGSFEYPTNVGNVAGTSGGVIPVTIPAVISTGTNYKLRIVASAYPMVSENFASLSITNANSFAGYDVLSGLILHYPMDGDATDVSGLGNDGTLDGTPTATADQFAQPNSALSFNSGDRIALGKPYPIAKYDNTNLPISFSFWLYQTSLPAGYGYLFSSWIPGPNDGLWIGTTDLGKVRFRINVNNYVEAGITNNEWQHFVCVYNGANIRIFRNGVQIALTPASGQVQILSDFEMGHNTQGGPAQQYNGKMDDFRVYNRALGANEAMTLYNGGLVSNNGPLCDGDDAELYGPAYAGLTYDWTGPSAFNSTLEDPVITPFNSITTSGTYALVLTLNGCVGTPNTDELIPSVAPVATVTGDTICAGLMGTISATGAASADHYQWFSDPSGLILIDDSTQALNVSPAATDTFYVNIKPGVLCQSDLTPVIVLVYQLPSVAANTSDAAICFGDEVTLSGSGASSYAWNNGVNDAVAFTPAGTLVYTVTGTDVNGCINTDDIMITVNPLPNVSANSSALMVCQGESITLTGSGAASYIWSAGVTNNVPFIPSSSGNYVVTGTDLNGCENSDDLDIVVNPIPATSPVSGLSMVNCGSTSENYSVTPTAGSVYQWTVPAGAIISSGQGTNAIVVNFNGNFGNVSVLETSADGCEGTAQSLTVNCNLSIETENEPTVIIYPNPAADIISISGAANAENCNLIINDMQGNLIFSQHYLPAGEIRIDVAGFSSGVYSGVIQSASATYTFKFTKL
jgi:hypothetical protein